MRKSVALSCATLVAGILGAQIARADLVTLNTGDAVGVSSFNTAGNWSNGAAPSAGNDYSVSGASEILLRTPGDANSYTFGGGSLTLNSGGTLIYKGTAAGVTPGTPTGPVNTYTINNLILNGGTIRSGAGATNFADFAGNISVTGSTASSILADQSSYIFDAPISGTAPLLMSTSNNSGSTVYTITINAANAYTGNLTYSTGKTINSLNFSPTSGWTFAIGASGVNNSIVGSGSVSGIVAFNGAFDLDLSHASANPGDSWTLVGPGLTPTYGATFSIPGFTNSGTTFSNGTYTFDETTGVLSVATAVPEPASLGIACVGVAGLLLRRRRKIEAA